MTKLYYDFVAFQDSYTYNYVNVLKDNLLSNNTKFEKKLTFSDYVDSMLSNVDLSKEMGKAILKSGSKLKIVNVFFQKGLFSKFI